MSAAWWLVLAGLPVFQHPLPESPGEPAVVAVATGRASLRAPCYALVCPDAQWLAPTRYTTLSAPKVPGALPQLRARKASPLATRRYASLSAPASRREWTSAHAGDSRVDAQFGVVAVRTPATSLQLELGPGYRLRPYADNGTAEVGPIARGGMQLSQNFGERLRLLQDVQVEAGRRNAIMRQTVGIDLQVAPQWNLRSNFDLRHDTAANGGKGETDSESSVKLRYAF